MPAISFAKAKEAGLLDATKIERFAIMYLAMIDEIKPTKKAFQMAAVQAGNTEGSFRELYRQSVKNMREKGCEVQEDEDLSAPTPTTTPVATPKSAGRKRKVGADDSGSPTPKKAARGKKAAEPKAVKMEDGAEGL